MPVCRIIAGPNGAGKTTFALEYLTKVPGCANFINVDLIAAGLSPLVPERKLLSAGRIFLHEVEQSISAGEDFAFETTLAGRGNLRLVERLRAEGWRVELIYLALPGVEMSKQRVAERVAHGGHDVPAADIERRFARSLRHLLEDFCHSVDLCTCFMNDGESPTLVFEQTGNTRHVFMNFTTVFCMRGARYEPSKSNHAFDRRAAATGCASTGSSQRSGEKTPVGPVRRHLAERQTGRDG